MEYTFYIETSWKLKYLSLVFQFKGFYSWLRRSDTICTVYFVLYLCRGFLSFLLEPATRGLWGLWNQECLNLRPTGEKRADKISFRSIALVQVDFPPYYLTQRWSYEIINCPCYNRIKCFTLFWCQHCIITVHIGLLNGDRERSITV